MAEIGSEKAKIACKTFTFEDKNREPKERLEVNIPEVLDPQYGMYVWPCAVVMARYLWKHRDKLRDKTVLELGAGVSLPGVLAALCGSKVILSDNPDTPSCLDNCVRSCHANSICVDNCSEANANSPHLNEWAAKAKSPHLNECVAKANPNPSKANSPHLNECVANASSINKANIPHQNECVAKAKSPHLKECVAKANSPHLNECVAKANSPHLNECAANANPNPSEANSPHLNECVASANPNPSEANIPYVNEWVAKANPNPCEANSPHLNECVAKANSPYVNDCVAKANSPHLNDWVAKANSPHLNECVASASSVHRANRVTVMGVKWGELTPDLILLPGLDYIIGSDVFYDPQDFEAVVLTVSFLLRKNPRAQFWTTYQQRSSDWSIEALLHKWDLQVRDVIFCSEKEEEEKEEEEEEENEIPGNHSVIMSVITLRD